ncbi:putative Allyl alcohol dehydrogenase-like protein [Cocos nucifera]|uniref:Putative Allyl alcohol dehydrogenase-like protein n=1 Tax=Cocos nucifera TaxID=13894 RepID=A0A8K0HUT1_COCNU|nr:putative Allyl alcohol dehydrogenase-like protein [Cocos nucifera]
MNGVVEVQRLLDVMVFEFGSTAASDNNMMLVGYSLISGKLEPYRLEIIPTVGSDAPQF